jgi:hypothetical protein
MAQFFIHTVLTRTILPFQWGSNISRLKLHAWQSPLASQLSVTLVMDDGSFFLDTCELSLVKY